MNQYDIDHAAEELRDTPVYGPAALYLQDYKDLINSMSDGWSYWSYGTKCAKDLEAIVQEGMHVRQPYGAYWDTVATATATVTDVKKAARKIETFWKRCKQTTNKPFDLEINMATEQTLSF